MQQIEKDLEKLGMYRMTLLTVVAEGKILQKCGFLLTKVEAMLSYDCTKRYKKFEEVIVHQD